MKKLHFTFVAILFALCAMVSFTACSSSDDNNSVTTESIKNNIVGTWQTTHISGWGYDNTKEENLIKIDQDISDTSNYAIRMLFKGDGTCYISYYSTYSKAWTTSSTTYTYDVSGNRIIIYYKNKVRDTLTVVSVNGDTAVVQYVLEEGEQYKTNVTCKRVY